MFPDFGEIMEHARMMAPLAEKVADDFLKMKDALTRIETKIDMLQNDLNRIMITQRNIGLLPITAEQTKHE